jgi:hypothetical protein
MKVSGVVGFALVSLCLSAIEVGAQQPAPSPEHVVLTRTADGFARANPDGTQSTSNFSVPSGQELCLFDIVFSLSGEPNATAMLTVSNTNGNGASWRILTQSVVLDSQGRAAGHETYKIGAKLSGNSRLTPSGTGVTGIGMTVLGVLRSSSSSPCQ